MNTNFCFKPGKLTSIIDASAGSSGKGKIGSFVTEHADNWQFCCNTFNPQAGHWVKLDDGRTFFYQTFNSCAYNHEKFEKMYIGQGGMIELPAFMRELEENKIPRKKIGISPIASILQPIDAGYEKGTHDLEGNKIEYKGVAIKSGTTAHGCGACRARKVLRKRNVILARDIPELAEFICDVPAEIMKRLDAGQAGLLEIAQGFQLSMGLHQFYPFTTSRNVTVAAGLDDMMLPPIYAGPVILNLRSFPIRINSNKYVEKGTGRHLTWVEVQSGNFQYNIEESNSGHGYPDQDEITWEQLTESSGSPKPLMEITSVTKLPRRVFTFSRENLEHAIKHNNTGHDIILSINFANYIDWYLNNQRGDYFAIDSGRKSKMDRWLKQNISPSIEMVRFMGTGPLTDDMLTMN